MGVTERAQLTTEMRVGKVVAYDTSKISVLIGGAVIPGCAYLATYQPVLGDVVVLVHQGSQWVVIAQLAGNPGDNAVTNPTFEDDTVGSAPSGGWGKNSTLLGFTSSTLTVSNPTGSQYVSGSKVLNLQWQPNGVAGLAEVDDDIYSPPIPVVPNELWAASAYVQLDGATPTHPYAVNVSVFLTWYADPTSVYPNTVAPDSPVGTDNISLGPSWYRLGAINGDSTGISVPAGARYMRVLLSSQGFFDGSEPALRPLSWDLVIAKKIRNVDGTYA